MASIGPQLPPHLQKRKRTPEDDDEQPNSPPAKVTRRDNDDEIALDDSDSEERFGPSAPAAPIGPTSIGPSLPTPQPPSVAKPSSIGPSLPPPSSTNQDEIGLSDSDSDDTCPAPPPTKRVLGPAPPPAPLSERPTTSLNSDSEDDDDDWGPALPGSTPSTSKPTASCGSSIPSSVPQAPKRDDWMIAPPTSSGYTAPDPTKLKSRKFASGPRASTEAKPGGVSSIWTETPEEKIRRLANAVLGREDPNSQPSTATTAARSGEKNPKRSEEEEARIRSFTEQTRGKSLVEEHQTRKAEARAARNKESSKYGKQDDDDDDDPSKRAFNWEKDMKVGGSISGSQKRQLLSKAANFGGRFEKGKYL
ncbi:hypothetical protein QBC44DRAFT_330892 [Cladorrhinum sp. PSN332]|nr:hypothetical protein QBC44DRAFT_330892 [Cladorrhinum sp. PSN332]